MFAWLFGSGIEKTPRVSSMPTDLPRWLKEDAKLDDPDAAFKCLSKQGITRCQDLFDARDWHGELLNEIKLIGDRVKLKRALANVDVNVSANTQHKYYNKNEEHRTDNGNKDSNNNKTDNSNINNNNKTRNLKRKTVARSTATTTKESNFLVKISEGVSRIDMNRTMLMGKFSKHFYDHSDVRLIYFSKGKHPESNKKVLIIRIFLVELFTDLNTNDSILSIRGPLSSQHSKYINGYYCNQLYKLENTSIKELESIAKYTINKHGEYSFLFNNCRHFSDSFMNNIIHYETLPILSKIRMRMIVKQADKQDKRITPQMLDKYIKEYFYDSLTFSKGKDEQNKQNKQNNLHENNEHDEKEIDNSTNLYKYTPIDFVTVLKEFAIVKNNNQKGVLQAGFLQTHSTKYGNSNDYYVLTDKSKLVKYKVNNDQEKKGIKQNQIDVKKRGVTLDDTNDCSFIIGGDIILIAKNAQIATQWKIAFIKCGGLQEFEGAPIRTTDLS